jgi:hypothetical protein
MPIGLLFYAALQKPLLPAGVSPPLPVGGATANRGIIGAS